MMAQERLILQLERELGSAVRQLEEQRRLQQEEGSQVRLRLVRVCEERQELRAELELCNERLANVQAELDAQLANWEVERASLERRLAETEASRDAAVEGERRVLSHASTLESRLASVQALHRNAEEQAKLKLELERRLSSQADQIVQLRAKLEDYSSRMAEASAQRKIAQESSDTLQERNRALQLRIKELESELGSMHEMESELENERHRTASIQASLESALRLSETREHQINALQQLVEKERRKAQMLETEHSQVVLHLQDQVEKLRDKVMETEKLRVGQVSAHQEQLQAQKKHVEQLTKQLARVEASFSESFPSRAIEQEDNLREVESLGESSFQRAAFEEAQEGHVAQETNRVLRKVLGKDVIDSNVFELQRSTFSTSDLKRRDEQEFVIPDVFEILNESIYGDPNSSAVSQYIEKVLQRSTSPAKNFAKSTSQGLVDTSVGRSSINDNNSEEAIRVPVAKPVVKKKKKKSTVLKRTVVSKTSSQKNASSKQSSKKPSNLSKAKRKSVKKSM